MSPFPITLLYCFLYPTSDELPLERFENMENKIEGLERANKMGHDDEIVLARVRTSTLEILIEDIQIYDSIIAELDNSLLIILKPLESEPVLEKPNEMALKRTSTSAAPTITQAAIRKLVADSVAAALEAQAATMENVDKFHRNTGQSGTSL
ncbi:hypothetical protein Tco_0561008 [Tanacetum coccineum]